MRFKRIIALLLVLIMVMPMNVIAADPQSPQAHPLTLTVKDAETNELLEDVIIEVNGISLFSTDHQGIAVIDVIGTETVKLTKEGYILVNLSNMDLIGDTLEVQMNKRIISGPRITHTPLDTSDLNHLTVRVTALDESVQSVQMRTFYKCPYGTIPGDIVTLTRESGNDSVFTADMTYQVKSNIRDYNAFELIYFFAMSDIDDGFLQYPESIDGNTLEGALTVKLAEPLDLSNAPIVEHTPPTVTSFKSIPATFTITGLQEGDNPTINVYHRSELNDNKLSVVKVMGQLTHGQGSTYTVDLADREFESFKAHTIEYYITINRGSEWYYYPTGINPYASTGLYSIPIPQELYGSDEPELDKADLIAKINEAKDVYSSSIAGTGVGEYPGEAKDAFNTAIEAASHAKDTAATQAEIDAAYQDLAGSITAFKAAANKVTRSNLSEKYGEAIILYRQATTGEEVGQYPQQAVDALKMAYISAENVLNNPASSQEKIDEAYRDLVNAIQAFLDIRNPEPTKLKLLEDKINEAFLLWSSVIVGPYVGQYPLAASEALGEAISASGRWLTNSSSEAELDSAYQALNTAMITFRNAEIKQGDATALKAKAAEASDLLGRSQQGNEPGQYPDLAFRVLDQAIGEAELLITNPATQAEIDEAYRVLVNTMQAFLDAKITGPDKKPLQAAIAAAEAFLNASVEGTKVGQYPAGSKDILRGSISKAFDTLADLAASQLEVDQALTIVNGSLADFKSSVLVQGDNLLSLHETINAAKRLLNNISVGESVGQFPADAIEALEAAVVVAEAALNEPMTQSELDAAHQALDTAVTTFKSAEVQIGNDSQLVEKIREASSLKRSSMRGDGVGAYPDAAFDDLEDAIELAMNIAANPASQTKLDNAVQALSDAMGKFKESVIKAGDNKALQAAIIEAKILLEGSREGDSVGEYLHETIDLFASAIADAESLAGEEATQAAIDAAIQTLNNAAVAFKAVVIKEGDNRELRNKMDEARILMQDSIEGDRAGEYPSEAFDALDIAIEDAEIWIDSPGSQQQIDDAYQALAEAIGVFKNAKIKEGEYAPLLLATSEAKTLYDISPEGYGAGQYWPEVKALLKTAIEAAEVTAGGPSTQKEIEEALQVLADAVEDFQKSEVRAGDPAKLQNLIAEVATLLNNTKEGDDAGEYPAGSKAILQSAVTAASNVIKVPVIQPEIDQAYKVLTDAIDLYVAGIIPAGNNSKALEKTREADSLLEVSKVGTGVGQYPAEAMAALQAAFDAAVIVFDKPASQVKLDATYQSLTDAIEAFKKAQIQAGDSNEADVVVTEAQTLLGNVETGNGVGQYPAEAVKALEAAVKAAQDVLKNSATQAQIDAAKEALESAVATFKAAVNTKGDSNEADVVVAEAQTLLGSVETGNGVGQYPAEAVKALEAAVKAAQDVLENPATQAQIDAAKATLESAITIFKNAVNTKGDSNEADLVVTEAQTLLGNVETGNGVGQYPAEAIKALEAAVKAAQDVLKNPATQAQIDAAKEALESAVATFKAAVIKAGDPEQVQTKITAANTLLNESTEGYNAGQYPAGSKAVLQAAITAAENVIRTAATQAEIDKAFAALTEAYDTFRASVRTSSPVNSYTPPVPAQTVVQQPTTKITDGLNTVETGQGTVKAAASEVQGIMKAAKPVILESTLAIIDFGKNGLNVPELKQGVDASLELGTLLTEKSKTEEVLAGAKLDKAGLHPLGGKVLDLIAQLNYSNGTSERIKSFAEPVKVTINLKELGLTGDATNLTAVRFVPQADGTYKTIKLGGVYIPATNSFEFYTESFSLYSIVKADSISKITFKIDSREYSIGTLAKQTDVPPVVQEQRTLVPIRVVAEALGAEVKWDHATKTAAITLDGKVLTLTLGKLIEGMDVPAQEIDGRIMVPLRYVSETLGAYVMWFPQDKRVEIIR